MGELAQRQELLARLSQPVSYPGREADLERFLTLDRDLYQDRLYRLPDAQLRQEYLSVQDRLGARDLDDVTQQMLAYRDDAVRHAVQARSGLPDLADWHGIINHHPVATGLQALSAAGGERINLDYYAVEITRPPLAPDGHPMSPAEVLNAVRTDLNGMLDRGGVVGRFSGGFEQPIPLVPETPADGPYIHIGLSFADDGTVALTQNTQDHFRFSTVCTSRDWEHPVSGSRDFGYETGPVDHSRVYTRGADRPTGLIDDVLDRIVFHGADHLWRGWQRGIAGWVVAHGGEATILSPTVHHVQWSEVDAYLYRHDGHDWARAALAGLEHGAPPPVLDPPDPVIDLDDPAEGEFDATADMSLGQAPMSFGEADDAPPLDPSLPAEAEHIEYPVDWTPADPGNEVSEDM
jgi:hypothetical protein